MELNQNIYRILKLLAESDGKLSLTDIEKQLKQSRRTLYYNLEKLNQWLLDNNFRPAEIKENIVSIKQENKNSLKELIKNRTFQGYIFSKEERINLTILYIALSEKKVTIDFLKRCYDVSKNTVLNMLVDIRKNLANHGIEVKCHSKGGYYFSGDEREIRYVVMARYFEMLNNGIAEGAQDILQTAVAHYSKHEMNQQLLRQMEADVHSVEDYLQERFFSTSVYEIVLYILMIYARNCKKKVLVLEKSQFDDSDLLAAKTLIESFVKYGIKIDTRESTYIASVLLSCKVFDMDEAMHSLDLSYQLTSDIIDVFEAKMCVKFNKKDEMIQTMLMHIKPMVYRGQYRIKVRNTIFWEIKNKYYELYQITKMIMNMLSAKYGIPIDKDEICFISLYLGGFLDQRNTETNGKHILIVCGFGVGTSLLVKEQIMQVLGEDNLYEIKDVRQFDRKDLKKYDLVISTLNRLEDNQILYVSPLLTEYQKQKLMEWEFKNSENIRRDKIIPQEILNIVKTYAEVEDEQALVNGLKNYFMKKKDKPESVSKSLMDILEESNIIIYEDNESYTDAIYTACKPLVEKNVVTKNYAESVLNIMEDYGLYFEMREGILLAHGKPSEEVLRLGISITLFRQPIDFFKWGKSIRVIFMVATTDNHSHRQVIGDLLSLMKDETVIQQLLMCNFKDNNEIYNYTKKILERKHD
ncbi:BglG family transcription antiterminator [Eubacterium callanderi]|uniref:BglG family transcription antiterminator n=1 Tax=Eubacterium callanderi TaxID=53442 RepID=UPI001C2D56D2|nr:BglG family transcription antiterminator [Eubacterium callanderi]MBV1684086.1 BglG family transcription antiterminator [Eubacterium callanderi]